MYVYIYIERLIQFPRVVEKKCSITALAPSTTVRGFSLALLLRLFMVIQNTLNPYTPKPLNPETLNPKPCSPQTPEPEALTAQTPNPKPLKPQTLNPKAPKP